MCCKVYCIYYCWGESGDDVNFSLVRLYECWKPSVSDADLNSFITSNLKHRVVQKTQVHCGDQRHTWLYLRGRPPCRVHSVHVPSQWCTKGSLTMSARWVQGGNSPTLRQNGRNFGRQHFQMQFFSMQMYSFRLKFHWSLFLRVQLTMFQHWFR